MRTEAMDPLEELVGKSAGIQAVRDKVARLLQHRAGGGRFPPILIEGETGTGKGLLARLIHRLGPRADGPFVEVNCAAIPETLLEAELFGFERGAFTDARQPKPGLFQAANRGTIFLDEVGLLPEGLQAKLLTVLEERKVRRLGSTRSEPIDVWILAATNEDLALAARQRRFREDLYHRLARIPIRVPPLRERVEDIPLLAERFLARACEEYQLPAKSFAPDALAALRACPWPGNVRELANVIERVALLSDEHVVTAAMLGLGESAPLEAPEPDERAAAPTLEAALGDVERTHLLEALRETGWNVSRAAGRLGLSRNTLRYRIEKHKLRRGPGTPGRPPRARAPVAPPVIEAAPAAVPPSVRWERRRLALLRAVASPLAATESRLYASRATQIFVEKVQSFGGRVVELGPTGLVAAFGLEPVEDAPLRAAHTALAIQQAAERVRREGGEALPAKIGIHVAHLMVGRASNETQIDPEDRREGFALLESLIAEVPDEIIVVSAAAAPLLARRFDLVPRPSGDTVGAYQLVGRERPGLALGRRMARFVGRYHELELLKHRVAAARRGEGQAVGILGEAGVGKSRLLHELRNALRGDDMTFLRGRCYSYGSGIPYLPIIDIVRHACRISGSDSPRRVADKVRLALRQLDVDPDEWAGYLLLLLGVREGTERLEVLSDEAIRARTREALLQIAVRGSRQRPIVFAVEDLQWVDKTSEDCFAFLVEHLPGAPVMVLTTYRPGYRPPWLDRSFATQIALQPLSPEASLDLLRSLGVPTPEPVTSEILSKADGNPFFIEEILRVVGEQADPGRLPAVPDTIQEVLLARIERLSDPVRRLLQTASVLSREFSRGLLGALWPEPLEPHLGELTRLEFLREQSRGGEPVYVFKHALTQEVAYESLPVAERQALHAAAGHGLETLYADRLEEAYDLLSYQYARTDNAAKAVKYLTRAAERAARSSAHEEAVRALQEAAAHVGRLPAEERDPRLIDLLLRQASSLIPLGRFQEVLDLLLRHQEQLERLDSPALAARYYFLVGRTYGFLGLDDLVTQNATRAIEAAERCGDGATMGKAYSLLAMEAALSGRARQGLEYGRQALARLEKTDERYWIGDAHWAVGLNYAQIGDFEPALEAEGRAYAIGEDIGDSRLQTFAAWVSGMIYAGIGETEAAIAACERALERSPDPLNRAIAMGILGWAYLEKGDRTQAIMHLERSVQRLGEFRYRPFQGWFSAFLAQAFLLEHRVDRARDLATQSLAITRESNFRTGVGWAQQTLGKIAYAQGDLAAAETWLAAAQETFAAIHSRYEFGRTHLDRAILAAADGRRSEVATHVREAYRVFTALRVPKYAERAARLADELGVALE